MAKSVEAEVEKMKMLEERIKAPSIWGRVPCGVRFEDLQDTRYEDAVRLLKNHYLSEELTYRSVKLADDKEGTDEFVHNVRIWMKDKMSIAGQDVDRYRGYRKKVSAFSRTFSRVKITYNEKYTTVMTFYREIEKPVDLFEKLGVRRYFKIYVLALKSRYRHRGIAKEMLKAAIALSASANVPAIAGIFTTSRSQQIAEELGFEKHNELYYVRYLIDEQIVFWDTGVGNYGAALMAYRIPSIEEPQELKAQPSSRFAIQPTEDDKNDD
ncbi:unnamed protein product [Euphydryas editha]|uniref:N-acetyltransferase domain-containing protein n=1 Tax=Euphydryas editha TaxID=104508 RepID=A0AAU9UL03_EUPED|nr:unnamed protein product [Euphydryas editha]